MRVDIATALPIRPVPQKQIRYDEIEWSVDPQTQVKVSVTCFDLESQCPYVRNFSFKDVCCSVYPEGLGREVLIVRPTCDYDEDTGPFIRNDEVTLKAYDFIREVSGLSKDPWMDEETRARYEQEVTQGISNILHNTFNPIILRP